GILKGGRKWLCDTSSHRKPKSGFQTWTRSSTLVTQYTSLTILLRERKRAHLREGSWIYGSREHDRHGTRRLEQRPQGRGTVGQHDVGRERGQFRRVSGNFGGFGRGPADVDAHVAADGPAQHFASACRNAPTQA